ADDHIRVTVGNLSCFNASYEINPFSFFEKRESFLYKGIAFFFLRAVIYNGDSWILNAHNLLHIDGTHLGELYQMGRSSVHVGAAVDLKAYAVHGRNKGSQRRTFHTFRPSHKHLAAYQYRACTSGGNKSVRLIFSDHIQSDYNRR